MKVYVLLYLGEYGDWLDPVKTEEFEGIFETREAADAARMKLDPNIYPIKSPYHRTLVKSPYVVEEYEVKQ